MTSALMQQRGDTSANLTSQNPVLADRQICVETDTKLFKIGPGAWNDLTYAGGGSAGAIPDGSITGAKLANNIALPGNPTATTQAANDNSTKVATTGYVDSAVAAVSGGAIADGAVTANKLASDSVTTAKILDANVTTAKIADVNVTTAKVANSAITLAKMADLASKRYLGRTSGTTGAPEAIDAATLKADLAINNVDNTSDLNKPVSTAQQTALDLKANLAALMPGTAQGAGLTDMAIGFRNIPPNSQSGAYTAVANDSGKMILHPGSDVTARTFTIPANSSVGYPIGTVLTFANGNGAGTLTIAITSDTLRLAGAGTTGNRTLAANAIATATKVANTEWLISGTSGLT